MISRTARLYIAFSICLQEPDIRIDDAALELWKQDRLEEAEALLTETITASQNLNHDLLASRALVRARSGQWDTAIVDAEMVSATWFSSVPTLTRICTQAIDVRPSVIAYIAKIVAHVGNGERHKAYWTCDVASQHIHPSHFNFILLIKVRMFSSSFSL